MLPFKCAPWLARNTSIAVLAAGLAGCSSQPSSSAEVSCADIAYSVYDPAEPLNRGVFAFNRVVDDYALVNARVGFRASDGWTVFLWSRNLLDRNYYELLSAAPGNTGLFVGQPGDGRTIGLTLRLALKGH